MAGTKLNYREHRFSRYWDTIPKDRDGHLDKKNLELYFIRVTNTGPAEDLPNILRFKQPIKSSPLKIIDADNAPYILTDKDKDEIDKQRFRKALIERAMVKKSLRIGSEKNVEKIIE
jgi:hypothetical protein